VLRDEIDVAEKSLTSANDRGGPFLVTKMSPYDEFLAKRRET